MKWTLELLDACLKYGLTVIANDPKVLSCMPIESCLNCPLFDGNADCITWRRDRALRILIQTHYPELLI